MSDAIRVNGIDYSWGSIAFKVDGTPYYGFSSISHGDKLEMVKSWGMGRHHAPRARSAGKYTTENAKVTGTKSSVQALRDALATFSKDGVSYGTVVFQAVIQYIEGDDTPITEELVDCRWAANSTSHSENPDPLAEDFEVDYMYSKRNTLTLFDNSDGMR